jgi:hypothetical protein
MVVARPCQAYRLVAPRRRAVTGRSIHRDGHEALEQLGDRGRSETEIAVPALLLQREKPGFDEFAQVSAGGLRRNASGVGEFAGSQRPAIHEGQEHVRSCRVANQRGNFGNGGSADHRARITLDPYQSLRPRPKRLGVTAWPVRPTSGRHSSPGGNVAACRVKVKKIEHRLPYNQTLRAPGSW